jgi:hypothetical protein
MSNPFRGLLTLYQWIGVAVAHRSRRGPGICI